MIRVAQVEPFAIRSHRALKRYLTEQGYDYGALVAFSGTVRDGDMD